MDVARMGFAVGGVRTLGVDGPGMAKSWCYVDPVLAALEVIAQAHSSSCVGACGHR